MPRSLRFDPEWLPTDPDACPSYWSTLWAVTKDKLNPEDNDVFYCGEDALPRGSVVVFKKGETRIHLFDAFAELGLDEETEQGFREEIATLLTKERRTIKVSGHDALLGRAVESYNADTTLGGVLFKKAEETPFCMDAVVKELKDRNLIAADGIHRVSLIAIEKRAECINAFAFKVREGWERCKARDCVSKSRPL